MGAFGLPWRLSNKESACDAGDTGDLGSVSESGRFPEGGMTTHSPYSCLEKPTDREA